MNQSQQDNLAQLFKQLIDLSKYSNIDKITQLNKKVY